MTISLKNVVGLQRVGLLPSRSSKVPDWAENLPNASLSSFVELNSLKLEYTSLCDLIASPPTRGRCPLPLAADMEWCDISTVNFKDNLLKLAARAYLQPVGKQEAPEIRFLGRVWKSFISKNRSLIGGIRAFLQQKAVACGQFLHGYASGIMLHLNPRSLRFLQMRPRK